VERGVGEAQGEKGGHPGDDRPDGGVRLHLLLLPLLFLQLYLCDCMNIPILSLTFCLVT
jgi:hypothetical protein